MTTDHNKLINGKRLVIFRYLCEKDSMASEMENNMKVFFTILFSSLVNASFSDKERVFPKFLFIANYQGFTQ